MMFGGLPTEYRKAKSVEHPYVEVSEKEFVRLFMEYRKTTKTKALLQAKISKALGSAVFMGNQMVSIKTKGKK